ncbi:hypothetical protein ACFL2U_00690 [Patescibacteria group bacterium]
MEKESQGQEKKVKTLFKIEPPECPHCGPNGRVSSTPTPMGKGIPASFHYCYECCNLF